MRITHISTACTTWPWGPAAEPVLLGLLDGVVAGGLDVEEPALQSSPSTKFGWEWRLWRNARLTAESNWTA